jgi:hypothetical protein
MRAIEARIRLIGLNQNPFFSPLPVHGMDFRKYFVILLAFACIAMFVAGCTTTTTIGNPAPAQTAVPAGATAAQAPAAAVKAAPLAAATTPACPDKEVLTGNWDSREVGYASNHDVREGDVWTEAYPEPVTLSQKCWDATGTFKTGDCNGKLTGKIEKNVFSGSWTNECTNAVDSSSGTFSVTMVPAKLVGKKDRITEIKFF